MRRTSFALIAFALLASTSACSVELLSSSMGDEPAIVNTCKTNADCGANATCSNGACFATKGVVDEVLLEIVPEANSFSGGLSFLSVVSGLRDGARDRDVALPARSHFVTQVLANLPVDDDCSGMANAIKPTIQARVEFSRTGSVGGVPIVGLTNIPVVADTVLTAGSWNAQASLVPGTYDIYIQPGTQVICELPPRLLRGVEVPATVQAWAAPATLELPKPATLQGIVTRKSTCAQPPCTNASLEGWQVDVIEPQQGRVISTIGHLGATTVDNPVTNLKIRYQPLPAGAPNAAAPSNGPLIRISPPAAIAAEAPVVYWDLAAADLGGTGDVKLDMSGLPDRDRLVSVSGQVLGAIADPGLRANVEFQSLSLEGAVGLTAAFKQSVTTDDAGIYKTRLFPGEYRVVVIPVASDKETPILPPAQGQPMATGAATRPWAITEERWTISSEPSQTLGFVLPSKRSVIGNAYAGAAGMTPALGATLEAIPTILASQMAPLRGALAQAPVVPQNASVSVDAKGKFALRLDPGDFDLSLRTPESSNFAWWVWPGARVERAENPGDTTPIQVARLPYPVPVEGAITAPDAMGTMLPLRGAAVRAYARVPMGAGVTKVGDTRTDDMGRYRLRLPPSFGP